MSLAEQLAQGGFPAARKTCPVAGQRARDLLDVGGGGEEWWSYGPDLKTTWTKVRLRRLDDRQVGRAERAHRKDHGHLSGDMLSRHTRR